MRYPMRLLITHFLCFLTMTTDAQNDKFDTLWNGLTFNIYTGDPDSIVLPFLNNHFPYLAKRPEPGGWTMYPPGPTQIPKHGMHSLRVDRHPFIKTKHTGARIDLLTQEWSEGPPGIEATRVWIYFDSKARAESAYSSIIKDFTKIGAHMEYLTDANQKKVIIQRTQQDKQWESLSIVLKKMPNSQDYTIGILFFDDKGDPW